MADLDIKDIWAKGKLQRFETLNVDVDNLVGKKSKNVLYWVKFILWIEFGINATSLIFITFSLAYIDLKTWEKWTYVITMGVIVLYLFYYRFLIKSIDSFDYTGNVRSSLKKIYNYLRFYILHYKVYVWLVMPIAILIISFFSAQEVFQEKNQPFEIGSKPFWMFMLLVGFVTLITALIMHFIVNLIYGRKIKRLKGMIDELEG